MAAAAAARGVRVRGGCMRGGEGESACVCARTRLLCVPLRGGNTGAKKAQVEEKVGSIYIYRYKIFLCEYPEQGSWLT